MKCLPHIVCLLGIALICRLAQAEVAAPLVSNGGFESGSADWAIFVPDESAEKNCRFSISRDHPHSGSACAELSSSELARFCIGHKPIAVTAGDRYRVRTWFRAAATASFAKRTPGFSLRLTFPGARLQINADGVVTAGNPLPLKQPVSTDWTRVEIVIQIPPGVDRVTPDMFSYAKGSMFVDDVGLEKVDASVPVTPLAEGGDYASLTAKVSAAGPQPQTRPAKPGPVTTDTEIIAELNLETAGMGSVKAAIQTRNLGQIQQAYLDYRRHSSPARWKIMPSDQPAQAVAQSDDAGDQVAAHNVTRDVYHYGPPRTFMGSDFNWLYNPVAPTEPSFSNEFTYCVVARTEFWQHLADAYWKTRNEKYAQAWVEQLLDFAAKNPMNTDSWQGKATLWRTLDAATRMDVSWPYCYFHFRDSASFTPQVQWVYLKLMRDHALRLVEGLSDASRTGNWVTDECFGLYTIGALFPELKSAANWRDMAINRLLVEFNRMVPPDGMEAELTPGYHAGARAQFQGPYDLAKLNNLPIPDTFREKILSMYRAPVLVMQPNGQDVCTNDSWIINAKKDAVVGLKVGEDPLLQWVASGGKSGIRPPDSTCLPYAGFYALRSGWDWQDLFVFFRAGPPGIGHEHQDMLQLTMRAWDTDLLIEPGTYAYDRSIWRRYFVGTASHNTIIVDDKWQHRPQNQAPVTTPVNNPWVTTPLFDYAAGTYDAGYQKNVYKPIEYMPVAWEGTLDKSIAHTRRVLFLRPYYVLVVDTLDGTGHHTFEAHYNMDAPAAHVDQATQAALSDNPGHGNIVLLPLEREHLAVEVVQGQQSPLLGWKPKDGNRVAIPTARFIKQQDAPAIFATFLLPYRGAEPPRVTTEELTAGEGTWAKRLTTAQEQAEVILVRDGASKLITFASKLTRPVTSEAAGLVLRQPTGKNDLYLGVWGASRYDDSILAFTAKTPVNLLAIRGEGTRLRFFNADTRPVAISLTHPGQRTITLPPQNWVDQDGNATEVPQLFEPFVPKKK